LLWRVLGQPQATARRAAAARSVEALPGWAARSPFRGAAPRVALTVQALLGYVRIPNIRLMLLAGVPYCILFPVFLRGTEMRALFVFGMLWVPVMFFISVKSNLLGADPSAVRACWWYPVDPAAPIRAKLTAVNVLATGLAALMYTTIAIMSPHVVTTAGVWSAFAFWISQLALTDALGAVFSVSAPQPVTWGRAAPSGNDAQILVASGATGGLTLAFTIASALTIWLRAWWLLPATATIAMIVLLLVRRAVLTTSLPRLIQERRDLVLAALPLGS